MKNPLVLFLVGPTASGKSEIALELARSINAEIISADSMQVYRGMDILSAKPAKAQRRKVRHHLIDILDQDEEFSAAAFRQKAIKLIARIHKRKKIPLVTGGTGLYIRALTHGLFEDKGKDEALRAKLFKEAEQKGIECLYERLKRVDPEAAEKIHPHNLRRVIRALEAFEINKIPFSRLGKTAEPLAKKYRVRMFGILRQREELYRRINERVDKMFELGLVEEVRRLLGKQLSRTAQQALGIKQISAYLEGTCSLDEAKELLKRDTRRYAKRQLTWFRREQEIKWIPVRTIMKSERKITISKTLSRHIEEEFRKSPEFRKAYDEEVARLQIGYKIARLKQLRHLSQAELAKKVATTQQTISRLEDLHNSRVNIRTLARITAALKAKLSIDFIPRELSV